MEESELMVKLGAATEPKSTTLLPVKFVPLMVTKAPPAVVPPPADRASLLTALVMHAIREFAIDLSEMHQDTTTVSFSGDYADQRPAEEADRPPRITFGYNKDHRPDLKQLLYSITISADGAVPVHCKTYDGNTTDDSVHQETWTFLRQIIGHADFLYVADSKGAGGSLRRAVPADDQRQEAECGGGAAQVQVSAVRGEAARATQERL